MPPPTINPHARAALVGRVEALMQAPHSLSLRGACSVCGVSPASLLRWQAKMAVHGAVVDGKPAGRPAGFELSETESDALKGWHLRRGSLLLAIEDFILDPACSPDVGAQIRNILDTSAQTRKPAVIPPSLRRAGMVTDEEHAMYRGRKTYGDLEVIERKGIYMRDANGLVLPTAPNSIWESDDMSSNEPFRFTDAGGIERVGRQTLFSIDVFACKYLGMDVIGRERDAYRIEDIAEHMREMVDAWGLPMEWRLERGSWDSNWLHGINLTDDVTWGGLGDLFTINHTWKSRGKGTIESSFNLLQDMVAGQSMTIGRKRGEFEEGTRHYLRANNLALSAATRADSLRHFWNIDTYAAAMAAACDRFNHRPKSRLAHGQAMVVAEELYAGGAKRECPADQWWRFCPIKKVATVRNSAVEVTETVHYKQTYRFRVNGVVDGVYLPHGLRVAIAFHPGHPERGAHIFNADGTALNREAWPLKHPLLLAEYMPLRFQVDHLGGGDFSGRKKANAHVRKESRSIQAAGTAGHRTSTARDGLGNALVVATGSAPFAEPAEAGRFPVQGSGFRVRHPSDQSDQSDRTDSGNREHLPARRISSEAADLAEIHRLEALL